PPLSAVGSAPSYLYRSPDMKEKPVIREGTPEFESLTNHSKMHMRVAIALKQYLQGDNDTGEPIYCRLCKELPLFADAEPVNNAGCMEFCHKNRGEKGSVGSTSSKKYMHGSLCNIVWSAKGLREEVAKGEFLCTIHAAIETTFENSDNRVWGESDNRDNWIRVRNEAYVNTLKLRFGCCLCFLRPIEEGYARILECDHISGSKNGRASRIAQLVNNQVSIERLDVELRLVRCLCSHCHMLHTAGLLPDDVQMKLDSLTVPLRTEDNNDLAAVIARAVDTARKEGCNIKACTLAGLAAAKVFQEDASAETAKERLETLCQEAGARAAALP
ncbi:hypothetical protein TrRE_jg854, partial [Triparma retinervis]